MSRSPIPGRPIIPPPARPVARPPPPRQAPPPLPLVAQPIPAAPVAPPLPPAEPVAPDTQVQSAQAGPGGDWFIAGAVFLIVATILVYAKVIHGGYIWDDNYLVWQNAINQSSDGLRRIWLTREPFDFWPVTGTVFWAEWQTWGDDPLSYHLQNVLLHALNAILLWLVLRKLAVRGAWLASAIFAFHPVCVETIGWIAELKTVLSTTLGLIAVWLYLDGDQRKAIWEYWAALVVFALAMLAKSSLAGLPVLLIGYHWWKDGSFSSRALVRSIPFFVVALATAILTVLYQYYSPSRHDICMDLPVSFLQRLAGSGWAIWFYFYKTLLPFNLIEIYPHWHVPWKNPFAYLPGIALLGALWAAWRWRATAWGWPVLIWLVGFVALMFPVLGFFNMSYMMHSLVADHFQYQAMILTIATAVALACKAASRLEWQFRVGLGAVAAGILGTFAWLSVGRAGVVASQQPLWRDTIARNPKAWMAYYELGTDLAFSGDRLAGEGKAAEALTARNEAIERLQEGGALEPDYPYTWTNLAAVLTRVGRWQEAVDAYKAGIKLDPTDAKADYDLAQSCINLGKLDDAIASLRNALQVSQGKFTAAQVDLANLLINKKDPDSLDEARKHLLVALKMQPDLLMPMMRLAQVYVALHDFKDASNWLHTAITKYPADPGARKLAGDLLVIMNRPDDAIPQYEEMYRLGMADADTLCGLGVLLVKRGQFDLAIEYLQAAVKANPMHAVAFNNLGFALERAGRLDEAIAAFQRSLSISPDSPDVRANLDRVLQEKRASLP